MVVARANMKEARWDLEIDFVDVATKMRTPTLIWCDLGDYGVPITQAYKLYHALKDNGVTVKFVAYPVMGSRPADPIRARDVWRRWTAWVELCLNEDSAKRRSVA